MSKEKLIAYEDEFDALVKQFPLLKIPVRAPLTALHVTLDSLFNGSRLQSTEAPRPDAAHSAGARLSYLIPLLMDAPSEPTGESAEDALDAVNNVDSNGIQRIALLSYGHFCEVMPEIHRDYFSVAGDVERGFTLTHRTPEFGQHEALDIILNELALASGVNPPADILRDRFDDLAAIVPRADHDAIIQLLSFFVSHHREFLKEPPVLTDEGYRAAIGVDREEFERFRVALFAIADWCKGMSSAIDRRIRREGRSDALRREMLEWISVNWKADFFLGLVASLSKLTPPVIEQLLELFTVDFRDGRKSAKPAGDGFFPPLARFSNSYLFNPDLLKLFLPARNILFALNRVSRKTFDNFVSQHQEPQLIEDACQLLRPFGELVLVKNYQWGNGEIDLLVYCSAENAALHVQAKAVIAPQGARMVQTVEARIQEGIDQLQRFRALGQIKMDEILSTALKTKVQGVDVIDVLLSRSCFGTTSMWSKMNAIVPLTPILLAGLANDCADQRKPLSLRDVGTNAWRKINQVMQEARPQWVTKSFPAGRTMIHLPMLDFDVKQVWEARKRMWNG